MKTRRIAAVAVLALPVVFGLWAKSMTRAAGTLIAMETPRYDLTSAEIATLPKEQLTSVATHAIEKHKTLAPLWEAAYNANRQVYVVLTTVIAFLAAIAFLLLWRSPPNNALQGDGPRPAGSDRA